MDRRVKVEIPEITDMWWFAGPGGVIALGFAAAQQSWQLALAGLFFLLMALASYKFQGWIQRRYDEEHPDGVDLRMIEKMRKDPNVSEDELQSWITPWDPSGRWIGEANDYLIRLKAGDARPLEAPTGSETEWQQAVDVESAVIGQLTAMIFGSRPDARWTKEMRPTVDDPSWRRRWPELARLVDGSMRLIESVTP